MSNRDNRMNVPIIRFQEFDGEWKMSRLSECLTISNEKNSNNYFRKDDVLSVSDDDGVVNQIILLGRSYAGKSVSNYSVLKTNQIVYTKSPLKSKPYGIIKVNKGLTGIVSVLYAVYDAKDGVDPEYIHYYFDPAYRINKYLAPLVNKGAKNTMNISDKEVLSGQIFIPTKEEQKAIAQYLRNLDSLIQTTEKKIASLKQVKEASLQAMFPAEGETVPKVRFKGFEGEWEVEQASTIFKTYNERNHPELPVLSAFQDIRGMAIRTDNGYEISHDKRNEVTYKVVRPGQFVMHLRSFQGGFAHSAVTGITSPAYTILGFKTPSMHNDYFWKIVFMSQIFINRLKTITYGIRDGRSISFQEFERLSFLVPNVKEQDKIAEFIHRLNDKVELEELRLKKLKQIKSACLDAMFV